MFEAFEQYHKACELMTALPEILREHVILKLLFEGKLEYTKLTNLYVRYLKAVNQDHNEQLQECDCILLELLLDKRKNKGVYTPKNEFERKAIQRALYFMNTRGTTNMNTLNERFGYDHEFAKTLSWYERNKAWMKECGQPVLETTEKEE